MTRSLVSVKAEIRILGIDTCRKSEVLGVVIRGGSFLDGVVQFTLGGKQVEQRLSSDIHASKYYPELRALMIHDPRDMIEREELEKLVDLPVIKLCGSKKERGFTTFLHRGRKIHYQSSLPPSTMSRILAVTWLIRALPEPARIAHLLAKRGGSLRVE